MNRKGSFWWPVTSIRPSPPPQVLAAAAGLDRAAFAEEMGRALSLETLRVALAGGAAERRQRRRLLRSLGAAVACERLPLLAWRDEARALTNIAYLTIIIFTVIFDQFLFVWPRRARGGPCSPGATGRRAREGGRGRRYF